MAHLTNQRASDIFKFYDGHLIKDNMHDTVYGCFVHKRQKEMTTESYPSK